MDLNSLRKCITIKSQILDILPWLNNSGGGGSTLAEMFLKHFYGFPYFGKMARPPAPLQIGVETHGISMRRFAP